MSLICPHCDSDNWILVTPSQANDHAANVFKCVDCDKRYVARNSKNWDEIEAKLNQTLDEDIHASESPYV